MITRYPELECFCLPVSQCKVVQDVAEVSTRRCKHCGARTGKVFLRDSIGRFFCTAHCWRLHIGIETDNRARIKEHVAKYGRFDDFHLASLWEVDPR